MYAILEFGLIEQMHPWYAARTEQEGFCNPRAVEVCETAEQAKVRAQELNELSEMDKFYKAAQILDTDGKAIDFTMYEPPPDTSVWHSAKEVCEMFGITRARLTQLTLGAAQTKRGKTYTSEAVIRGGVKYTLEGRGKKVFYNDAALDKLKKYLGK